MSYKIKEEIQILKSRESSIRRRGRPRGNPKPLNEEEKRRRNAQYERERRAITSGYINHLGAMLGLKPRTSTETIVMEAIRALNEFKNKEVEYSQKINKLEHENSVLKAKAQRSRQQETEKDQIKVIATSLPSTSRTTSTCETTYWVDPTTSSSESSPSHSEPSSSRSEPGTGAPYEYATFTHLPTSGIDDDCKDEEEIGIPLPRNNEFIEDEEFKCLFEINNFPSLEEMFKSNQDSMRSIINDETCPTNDLYTTSTLNWL